MPHKKSRGNRKPSTYERKMAKKQAEQTLQEQQRFSRNIINSSAFHDRVNGEKVNILEQKEIINQLTALYPDAPPQAIPTVQDGSVLTIPNLYHLELFPDCNQAAL